MNVHYFEPDFIFYLVVALFLIYPVLFIVTLATNKLNFLGKILFGISAFLYAYVILYSYEFGVYLDQVQYDPSNETGIFGNVGYFHLILLTFPYIFLSIGFSSKPKVTP